MAASIYYEKQKGGLCRLHALNAYFGKHEITQDRFNKFKFEYDIEYKKKYDLPTSCSSFDIVNSDQNNIIGFILRHYGICTRYYAINQMYKKKLVVSDFFFIYNPTHIYGCRKVGNMYFTVDSMSGVKPTQLHKLTRQQNIGFIVPVDADVEYNRNRDIIKKEISGFLNPTDYLITYINKKIPLGNIEVPLSICMDIIYMKLTSENISFDTDENVLGHYLAVSSYDDFLSKFTRGNYLDLQISLMCIKSILFILGNS